MFGFGKKEKRKSRKEKKQEEYEAHYKKVQKGLLFWVPGGASRLDVYLDYCVMRSLGKTKMEEKERVIPFSSIIDVKFVPPSGVKNGHLQLITKEMPDVKPSHWYAYENNLVVTQPTTEDLAKQARDYILNPNGGGNVPPEYLMEIRQEMKQARREEKLARAKEEEERKAAEKAERARRRAEKEAAAAAAKAEEAAAPEAPAEEPAAEEPAAAEE